MIIHLIIGIILVIINMDTNTNIISVIINILITTIITIIIITVVTILFEALSSCSMYRLSQSSSGIDGYNALHSIPSSSFLGGSYLQLMNCKHEG